MTAQALATRIFMSVTAGLCLLFVVRAIAPTGSVEPLDYLMLAAYVAALLAHQLGVPGVLEHNGLCGWGMCSPTPLGWTVAAIAWLCLIALLSGIVAWIWSRRGIRRT